MIILGAPTSIAQRQGEDTLTYLNKGREREREGGRERQGEDTLTYLNKGREREREGEREGERNSTCTCTFDSWKFWS